MIYDVAILFNDGEGRFDEYEPGSDKLLHRLSVKIDAPSAQDALNKVFEVGNRMGRDAEGAVWPNGQPSLSVGDVILLDNGADPESGHYAVARFGFDKVRAYDALLSLFYGTESSRGSRFAA